jgi:hypothetical protein
MDLGIQSVVLGYIANLDVVVTCHDSLYHFSKLVLERSVLAMIETQRSLPPTSMLLKKREKKGVAHGSFSGYPTTHTQ